MFEVAAGRPPSALTTEASVGGGSDANFVTPPGVPVGRSGGGGDGSARGHEHVLLKACLIRLDAGHS